MIRFSFPTAAYRLSVLTALFCLLWLGANGAAKSAGTYKDIHDFGFTVTNANGMQGPDGVNPLNLIVDRAGNIFGTTEASGPNGNIIKGGILWEITSAGVYKDLHDFGGTVTNADGTTGPDGLNPSDLVMDSSGNLFGTAEQGGPNKDTDGNPAGMVWEITSGGTYKDLHDFGGTVKNADGTNGPDGSSPGGIVIDSSGDIFGDAVFGGPNVLSSIPQQNLSLNAGMIWEITSGGTYKDLHDFGGMVTNAGGTTGFDGTTPASITIDSAGNLFGCAGFGGPNRVMGSLSGSGMVWEITSGGTYRDLHDFNGMITDASGATSHDGVFPEAVAFDGAGNMFGTAEHGGPNTGHNGTAGILWEITTGGVYKDIHDFGGMATDASGVNAPDGANPVSGPTFDIAGNMYGTTTTGGPNEKNTINGAAGGTIWEITSSGVYKDLHDFLGTITNANGTSGSDGSFGLHIALDVDGNMFGLANTGGPGPSNASELGSDGMVWKLSGVASPDLTFPAGLQLISTPYAYPIDPLDTLFGYNNPTLAIWSQPGNQYILSPNAPANQVGLGQAFWVKFPNPITITATGVPADTTKNFDIPLVAGWNMIGDPFPATVPVTSLLFNNGTETFAQATTGANPLVGSVVWNYSIASGKYAKATSLVPQQGYWIFAFSNTDVQVPHP
jgi:hypothetical protein